MKKKLKISKFVQVFFKDTTNLARLTVVFLLLLNCKAQAQNNALNFDGVDDYVKINNTTSANFTIEAWVKFSVPSHTGGVAYEGSPIAWSDVGGSANDFSFSILNNHLAFFDGSNNSAIEGTINICDDNWHRVAIVRTAGSTSYLYVDGVRDGSGTSGSNALTGNPFIEFGGNTLDSKYYNGNIDELRIWNSARTQSQIQANMVNELTGTETGLISYYNFNHGSANANNSGVTTLNDLTSNNNNGNLNNFSLSGTTSNWVAVTGVINATVPGTVSSSQTITTLTSSGVSTITGENNLDGGGSVSVSPSMSDPWDPWGGYQMPAYNEAQSFKASKTTLWSSLKIKVQGIYQEGDFTLQIFSGDGVNGSTLLSQTVSIYNTGINTITFSSPISIVADQFYTFQLSSNGSGNIDLGFTGATYPLGTFYQNGNGYGGALYFENIYQINNANWNNLTLTGNTGNVLYWQRSTDAGFSNPTTIANTSTTLYSGLIGNLSGTTYFRAVVKFGSFPDAYTNTVTISASINTSNTTQVRALQCGTTLATINSQITADTVPAAQMYRFEVTNGSNVSTFETTKRNFDLTKVAGSTYATTYSIKVAVRIGGTWGAYGTSCNVTTPTIVSSSAVPVTSMRASQCGTTLATMGSPIHSQLVYGAEAYRFQLTNGATVTEVESPIYYFFLTNTAIGTYGTTFSVKTAAKVAGVWGNYGASCNISTPALTANVIPTTTISTTFCGATLAALTTKFSATLVFNAQGYRFEITKGAVVTVYDSPNYNLRLSDAGIVPTNGTTYSIRVAAKVNGVYGILGASCNVTTPGGADNSRQIVEKTAFSLVAYPNPSSSAFKIEVNGADDETVSMLVFDMTGRQIENKVVNADDIENISLGQNYSSGVYNVIVSQGINTKTIRLVKN